MGSALSEEHRKKISESMKGHKVSKKTRGKISKTLQKRKGDSIKYVALHRRMAKLISKPKICPMCQKEPENPSKRMHLHNISHQYRNDIKDWGWLCPHCHKLLHH